MKAILEFDLPEEISEHLTALKSKDLLSDINVISNEIRDIVKYRSNVFLTEPFESARDLALLVGKALSLATSEIND